MISKVEKQSSLKMGLSMKYARGELSWKNGLMSENSSTLMV